MYKKSKRRALAVVSAVLILGILYFIEKRESLPEERLVLTENTENESETEEGTARAEDSTQICVYICGSVRSPGVYNVPEGARIYEVLALAGGFSEDAEKTAVNLAETVTDGEAVLIPSISDVQNPGASVLPADGRVNINTADMDELMTLPGIGKAKAEAVIAYRKEHGKFTSVEELMGVSGIGESVFGRLRDRIKI